ncbi:MAG: hypothetical protein E7626_00740 [Ruminococcaceae bacterium]|nr:hypothetical protein [Oscillospiraceae bacterium]
MKRTRVVTLTALLSASASAVLCLGSALGDLDLTFAAAASLFVFFACIEISLGAAITVWAATSAISFMLAPSKFAALMFTVFVGLYPIIKLISEKHVPLISWTVKIVSVNVATVIIELLAKFVFFPNMHDPLWVYVAVLVLANATTVIFDLLLGKLAVLYFAKFRKRLGIAKYLGKK